MVLAVKEAPRSAMGPVMGEGGDTADGGAHGRWEPGFPRGFAASSS